MNPVYTIITDNINSIKSYCIILYDDYVLKWIFTNINLIAMDLIKYKKSNIYIYYTLIYGIFM